MHDLLRPRRVAAAMQVVAAAAAVTAAIALSAASGAPMVTLIWADGIGIAPGVSVTPAPGWTVESESPGWVMLRNASGTAELEIKVKPAGGTDPVAVLEGDIGQLSSVSTTGLANVRTAGAPAASPVRGANFQQQASVDYNADGPSQLGVTPVTGSFSELLNTSTHQSAFIVFVQNGDATARAGNDGQAMIDSLL